MKKPVFNLILILLGLLAALASRAQSVTSDKLDYAPGEVAIITGAGWTSDQFVDVHFHEDPEYEHDHDYHDTPVNPDGTFRVEFPIELRHLGVTFTVEVYGQQSGVYAYTIFTDANYRVQTSSGTATVGYKKYNGTNCTGTFISGTINATSSSGSTGSVAAVDGQSLLFEAPLTNSESKAFLNWIASAGNPDVYYTTNSLVCINGRTNGNATMTAQFCAPASFTKNPGDATVTYGSNAQFQSEAGNESYQWEVSTDNGSSWNDVPGATTKNLTLQLPTVAMSGNQYRAKVNTCNTVVYSGVAVLTVNARAVTVTADAKSKTYGSPDPTLTYQLTSGTLVTGDEFSGSLSRVGGENVGQYDILQNTLSLGSNYSITFIGAKLTIDKATAIISVEGYSGIYDGVAHGSTGTAIGVHGETLAGLSLGAVFTNVPGGTANWTFTDITGNYYNTSGMVSIEILKATATIVINDYTGVYDGEGHGITGSATGVLNELLAGLDLGDSFTNVPGGSVNWTFTDETGNYHDAAGIANVAISKADAFIQVTGYTGTYDGEAHGATGSATGVKGEPLGGLDLGVSFTNFPGGTAQWVFTDLTGNYKDDAGDVAIVIDKADPIVSVSGYTGVYDGDSHGATGSATGVKGEALSGLDLGESFTNVPGGTANWAFVDVTGNYNDDAGEVAIVISKATAVISVSGYTGTYDGDPHSATGSATGVKGESLSGLDLGASFTNVPGGTAHWLFTDVTGNYQDDSGNVAINLEKANPVIVVNGYTGIYDGNSHGATGSAIGVKGEVLTGLDLGTSFTDVPGGAANWSFNDVTGNYFNASGSVGITIEARPITIAGVDNSKFCGQVDPALAYAIVSGELVSMTHISGNVVRETGETVGTYAILQGSVALTTNYALTFIPGVFTVNGVNVNVPDANSVPVAVGTTVALSATVSSAVPGNLDGIPVVFLLDDGNPATADITKTGFTDANGVAGVSITGLLTEVYKITATAGSNCASVVFYKPIYDPNGGFVTGGGWINSLPGAYSADLTLAGKANFGFVSKYKKGSSVPEGNTEFQFHAGSLNFASSSYNAGSLVVAGSQAIYKGTGTINGSGNYQFMVSVVDGSPDKFRIKIMDGNNVIYDNNMGADDNANAATALAGGSIVIQSAKTNKASREDVAVIDEVVIENLSVYPNPVEETVHVSFRTPENTPVNFNIIDSNGRSLLVQDRPVNMEGKYDIDIADLNLRAGLYVLRVAQGRQLKTVKLLKK